MADFGSEGRHDHSGGFGSSRLEGVAQSMHGRDDVGAGVSRVVVLVCSLVNMEEQKGRRGRERWFGGLCWLVVCGFRV